MLKKRIAFISLLLLTVLVGHFFYTQSKIGNIKVGRMPTSVILKDYFLSEIKPILDYRCVVCHACYNSPCQLKFTSYEGIMRGATKIKVYDNRPIAIRPTRLYTDAQTPEEWHKKGFSPVVDTNDQSSSGGKLDNSILYQMISHNRETKQLKGQTFEPEKSSNCPLSNGEFQKYASQNPNGGMPFGFPPLIDSEFFKLEDWVKLGAPGPSLEADQFLNAPSLGIQGEELIQKWEAFFNAQDNKTRLVARYIYEHLFLAHIYFKEMPSDFYMLVRSKTPYPERVIEIPTRRPYDNPGEKFYYRFRKISETIVHKTHILYELSDKKMSRYNQLFFQNDWPVPSKLPGYEHKTKSNPFIVFKDIPAKSRYQFLLDDAQYITMTFIRGPVCKGNIAVNVVNDHFYIFFLDPKADLSSSYPSFLTEAAKYLDHPAKGEENAFENFYPFYKEKQLKYLKFKKEFYEKHVRRGPLLQDIWRGEGYNHNAVLTVFRHGESANVEQGAIGGVPKTSVILDYTIFERIYYSLVAGFDVFGSVSHQLATRLYMDNLRVEGEDLFLSFLPIQDRESIRSSWYKGTLAKIKMSAINPYYGITFAPAIDYHSNDSKKEFISKVLNKYLPAQVRGQVDRINGHDFDWEVDSNTTISDSITNSSTLEQELRKVANRKANYVNYFPQFSLLRVKTPDQKDLVYSIMQINDYYNISFALWEEERRNTASETLFFVKGYHGSYPNLFFVVDLDKMPLFLKDLQALPKNDKGNASKAAFSRFMDKYGVRRSDPKFWEHSDWFNKHFFEENPLEAGFLDLNRYENL